MKNIYIYEKSTSPIFNFWINKATKETYSIQIIDIHIALKHVSNRIYGSGSAWVYIWFQQQYQILQKTSILSSV